MAETATTGSDLWQLILDLHGARNLAPIKDMPDGVWKQALPGGWFMAVNGGDKVQIVAPEGGMAVPVERFEVAFWFNGWLAGTLSPLGGTLAAGEAANIDTLAEALRLAIKERGNG